MVWNITRIFWYERNKHARLTKHHCKNQDKAFLILYSKWTVLHSLPSTHQEDIRLRVRNVVIIFDQRLRSTFAIVCSMADRHHTSTVRWLYSWLGGCLRDGSAEKDSTSWPPRSPCLIPLPSRLMLWNFMKDEFYVPLTTVTLQNLQGSNTNGDCKTSNNLNGRLRREVHYRFYVLRVTNVSRI
jgi:hypothetical protein